MKRSNNIWLIGFLCFVASACGSTAMAQNVVFSATVNANKIGAKDQLQITYTVRDAKDLRSINPGNISDFTLVGGPYRSSSSVSVNGKETSSISVTYLFQPKHTGTCSIPPAVARDGAGHTYQSNPVTVQVVSGTLAAAQPRRQGGNPFDDDPFGGGDPFAAMRQHQQQMMQQFQQQQQQMMQQMQQQAQPQAQSQPQNQPLSAEEQKYINDNAFIKVNFDKSKVHIGEQVTASYKLYASIPMQGAISKMPSLNGFWTQDFDLPKPVKPTEEIIGGKKYAVYLLKKSALFPQQTGTLILDPTEVEGLTRTVQRVRQNAYFSTLAYKDIPVHLKSAPEKIEVTPLPDKNKPANFSGGVGNFTINSKIDKQTLTTDDAATFTITIAGSGNIKLIEAPKLSLPNGLESYDPQIIDTITGRSNTISGSKIINYAVNPRTPGDYDIPSIPLSYYNPELGNYVTIQTQPIKIHVTAGKHYNPNLAGNNATPLADIHNIETKPLPTLSFSNKPLLFTATYWSMYAVPILGFIGLLVFKRREEEESKDTVLLRGKRANKVALKRLAAAQRLLQQNNEKPFYEEISKAIWLYLSDKLYIPLSSLSKESAREALSARKVPAELQVNMENILSECETSLYAQTGGSKQMQYIYKETISIISQLEDVI